MKVHFIGIGGFGMSGLAEYYLNNGYSVTGSDLSDSILIRKLSEKGAKIYIGHSIENLDDDVSLVVYTPAISPENPEYIKAKKLNIKIVKRAELLGMIVNEKKLIAVSGTHGKTTTSALIAYALSENNFDPVVFIGGAMTFLDDSTYRMGKSNIAVVEADEYDRSFLHLKPDIIVITSIDSDHLDIYKGIDDIKSAFKLFLSNAKISSKIIAYGDDENVLDLLSDVNKENTIFYGFNERNQFRIIECDSNSSGYSNEYFTFKFIVNNFDNLQSENLIKMKIKGKHNALNCLASFIVSKEIGLDSEKFINTIKNFTGVRRRMELKYNNNFEIYDDYAHHPTEIRATFDALKSGFNGKIITIFQPHLYTRTRDFYKEFADSLKDNDIVILTDIYPAREEPIENVSSKLIYEQLKNKYNCEVYLKRKDEIVSFLNQFPLSNSKIIFQGAGDITNICDEFVENLKQKAEKF